MSREIVDKSNIVWQPRFIRFIPDAREFTSLCLFHNLIHCMSELFEFIGYTIFQYHE